MRDNLQPKVEAPPHTVTKTDKGKNKTKEKSLSLFRHLALSRDCPLELDDRTALSCAGSRKMAPSRSLRSCTGGHLRGRYSNAKGLETAVQFLFTCEYAIRSSLAPGPFTTIAQLPPRPHDETISEAP